MTLFSVKDTVVVWVDAHTDINTMSTSNSGNMHGMPVSFNIPQLREDFTHADLSWLQPRLKAARLVYIGLRDVEREERRALERLNIPAYFMSDVDRLGLTRVVEDGLQRVDSEASRRIHLSFDIDALDPSEAPATGTPVRTEMDVIVDTLYILMPHHFIVETLQFRLSHFTTIWPCFTTRYCLNIKW